MTSLSRPLIGVVRAALETPSSTIVGDIDRLRGVLLLALRRCLDEPRADWNTLVEVGTGRGGWDEWRVASLLDSSDPTVDPAPEVTREALAGLANEMIERGDVLAGPWEGGGRQGAVESERWRTGRVRREMVFAIERAMDCVRAPDAAGLRAVAGRLDEHDPHGEIHPQVAASLRVCAEEIDAAGACRAATLATLRASLARTPLAAFIDE